MRAVVLGISGRSGGAIARAAAERLGMDVWGLHRDNHPEAAAAVAAAVRAADRRADLVVADAGFPETAEAHARALVEADGPGRVGLFVHALAGASVGPVTGGATDRLTPRQITRTFEIMTHSFVYWVRALHDAGALAPGARLVGLTNPMTDTVLRNVGAIAASKAALEVWVRHLAFELGPEGYRVNLVKYGGILSSAVERTFPGPTLDRLSQLTPRISPAGRMCTVEEVAELVCFLARPEGAWFNGATIDFTGGEFQALYDALMAGH